MADPRNAYHALLESARARARVEAQAVEAHPWRAAFALLLLCIAVLLLLWDWNWFKGPVERQVEARTGRAFEIRGDLDVDLGRTTVVTADRLQLGNAGWSERPVLASTDRLRVAVEVWPLLRGDVRFPELRLDRPRAFLEKGPDGVGNWVFDDEDPSDDPPKFRRLWIDDGHLEVLDPASDTMVELDFDSVPGGPGDAAPAITGQGSGRWQGNPFVVKGRAESPLELRDRERPYRLDVRASAGATDAHARGTLVDPLRLSDFDLQLALSGADLEDLYPLLGLALPPTPPYELDGHFFRDGTAWHYDDFSGRVGDSDLAGDANVDISGARPYLRANLASGRLDLDDLGGFVGAPPGDGGSPAARGRLLPDAPYNLDKLRAMDADVRLRADRIVGTRLPLDNMDAHLLLEGGLLRLDPLDFGVASGNVRSTIRLDARESPIRMRALVAVRGLDLPRLMPMPELADGAIGRIGGDVALAGTGNSVARMLATSNGDVALGMGRGQVSNLLMEYAGLDIAEALKFLLTGDRKIPIRCAFADFAVDDGVMSARALAFDTTDTIIVGEGTVDLRNETLALTLRPRPKDRSLFVFRSPLLVRGTFLDPSLAPDPSRIGLRAAFALALGSIAPPVALLATIELGPGEDADCGGRYAK